MRDYKFCKRLIPGAVAVVLALAAYTQAFPGGTPVPVERSGFVLLRTGGANCTAVALTPDLLLTAKACLGGADVQSPEIIGWFMGTQDSDDNPVREVSFDLFSGFALLRLSKPLILNGRGASIYSGQDSALTDFRCYGFGPTEASVFSYGATLAYKDFHVLGMASGGFRTDPDPPVHPLDIGGACFRAGTNELAGMYLPTPITGGMLVGIARARGWITEFRATFEVVGEQSGLCLGSVSNGVSVWQTPCLPGDHINRRNQEWNIRRYDQSFFQLRSTRYPGLCLGGTPANYPGYGPDILLFYSCVPPLVNSGVLNTPLPEAPRREQLWAITSINGDAVEIRNAFNGKCLDVPGEARTVAGTQLWPCNNGPNQRFLINVDRFEGGAHRLASFGNTTLCADIPFASPDDGVTIQAYNCHGSENQQFEPVRDGNSHNQLLKRALGAGRPSCIGTPTAGSGHPIVQNRCTPGRGQEWLFRWLPNNIGYRPRSAYDLSQCLTLPAGAGSGTLLFTSACTNAIMGNDIFSQRWIVE